MIKKNRKRKSSGFADTKKYPHKGHPANYRRKGNDEIEYITFTHTSDVVEVDGKLYKVIPLNSNIDPKERKNDKNSKSYAMPVKFKGKRSALGKERYDLSFTQEDKKKVDKLYQTLPTQKVKYSKKK